MKPEYEQELNQTYSAEKPLNISSPLNSSVYISETKFICCCLFYPPVFLNYFLFLFLCLQNVK